MMKFYKCMHCGNAIAFLETSGIVPQCCGDTMTLLDVNQIDGIGEKHVPVIIVNGDRVSVDVGAVAHPMTGDHHIDWIVLETNKGYHVSYQNLIDGSPHAEFSLQKHEQVIAAYAYCNLHGLWAEEM